MQPGDFGLDLLDIAVVAWLFYRLLLVFRQTRALRILVGLGVLALVYAAARVFRFEAVLGLVDLLRGSRVEVGVLVLAVIFAEEIKDLFAGVFWDLSRRASKDPVEQVVDPIVRAVVRMAARHCGALIAVAGVNPLDRWELADSVAVDAGVTADLLETIFHPGCPLHDGAVVIRGGRIVAAKCQFPPSSSPVITQYHVGMRHRAGFGLCEQSDAVVLVLSEERGTISLAHRGTFRPSVPPEELAGVLRDLLGGSARHRPWYHPRRLLADAPLKACAAAAAFALWAEQETTLKLRDAVHVLDPETRAVRLVALRPGQVVLTAPASRLVPLGRDGDTPLFAQVLPPVEYELTGRNFRRLLFLPQLVPAWLLGHEPVPADLVGPIGIVLPGVDAGAGALTPPLTPAPATAPSTIACPLVHSGGSFELRGRSIEVALDRLAPLAPNSIRVAFQGQPAPDYTLLSESPVQVSFPGPGPLVVPSRAKEAVEAALNPCPTSAPISVAGRTESLDQWVELQLPPELLRWNPEQGARIHLVLEILWEKIRRDAQEQQLSQDRRRELESQRADVTRPAHEARERWADLEKRFKDGAWETGYRLEQYDTLVKRTLPDLAKRIERAQLEQETLAQSLERLRAETSPTRREQEIVKARLTICLKEQEWRGEILEALRTLLDLAQREAAAVGERIRPLLEAVERAVRQKEEVATTEFQLPPVENETDLQGLIEESGPAGAARAEGARAIAAAASSRAAVNLHSQGLTCVERWHDAVREAQVLTRETEALRAQLGAPAAVPAPIRVELALREKETVLEARRLLASRQAAHWTDLWPRLVQTLAVLSGETAILERLVRTWPAEAIARLAAAPVLDLFRETEIEIPGLQPGNRFLAEQVVNAGDASLSAEAGRAAEHWDRYAEAMRRRLAVLAAVTSRIVAGASAVEVLRAFEERESALAQVAQELRQSEDRTLAFRAAPLDIPLGETQEVARVAAEVAAASQLYARERDELVAQAAAIDRGLPAGKAPADLDAGALKAAAEGCVLRARLLCRQELLARLERRQAALAAHLLLVAPVIEPLLATLKSRGAELDKEAEAPQPERVAALAYMESRRTEDQALSRLEREVAALPAAPRDLSAFQERLVHAFLPLAPDDPGMEHLVALHARVDTVRGIVRGLEAPGPDETVDAATGRGLAAVEMRRRLRERGLAVRRARLGLLEETLGTLREHLVDREPVRRLAAGLAGALTGQTARLLPIARLEAAGAELAAAIVERRAQMAEARREAERRGDETERAQFARRAAALEARLQRLEGMREDLGRLLEGARGILDARPGGG
ncbi:MAG: DNA integrity scanning protein DisA nucleotide-binding domain protein [Planctomycetes bacterium]|nr:DNA integrity scanning protein DisA nucleotide-binding domain protein [Planctomycetota bacterium]